MKIGFGSILTIYAMTAGVFFLIDLFWLGYAAKELYARHIGNLLRDQVNWPAAIAFYAIYIGGMLLFAIVPASQGNWPLSRVALIGGLLGLFAYATFDLTSLALIRGWSTTIVILDLLWGTVLTGSTCAAVVWLSRALFKLG